MKRENRITLLLAAVFLYAAYRWAGSLYRIFVEKQYPFHAWSAFYIGLLLVGIVGLAHYYLTHFKRSQILRAYLLFSLVGTFFSLPFSIEMAMYGDLMQTLRYIAIEAAEVVIFCYSLRVLVAARTPEIINGNYFQAGRGKRFFNRLLDLLPFVIFFFNYMNLWRSFSFHYGSFDAALLYPIEVILLFLYYSLFEHFFHTTFGKTITNTTVIHVNGRYATLGTILLRSICRFIPFDALSFLFGKGWHDSMSATAVVDETYAEEQPLV